MTLHEHANRLCEAGNKGSLRGVHTILDEWYNLAYDELRAELDAEIKRSRKTLFDERVAWNRLLNKIESTPPPEPTPAEPPKCQRCDGDGFILEQTYWFDCPTCRNPSGAKPLFGPPNKAVYEWRGDTLFRGYEEVGRIVLTHKHPIPFWEWIVAFASRSRVDGQSKGSFLLAKAAVEAVVRAHYGDAA